MPGGLRFLLISALVIACLSATASGQTYERQRDSTWRMGEVVITADLPGFIPAASISIDRRRLGDRAVTSIGDALRTESGLTLISGAKAETEFRIRGFPANASIVLLDGHPLNSGYFDKVDLNLIPAAAVEAIHVMKGPTSPAHGPNAMGGIVHVITRRPREAAFSLIDAEAAQHGYRRLSVQHAQRFGRWGANIALYEHAQDAFPLSTAFRATSMEDGGLRDNSSRQLYGGRLHVEYTVSESERYSLLLASQEATRAIPATVYGWDAPSWRRFPSLHRHSASLSLQRTLMPETEATALLFYDASGDNLVEYRNPSFHVNDIVFDSRIHSQSLGGAFALRRFLTGGHTLSGGLRFRHDMVQRQPHTDREWMTHRYRSASLFLEHVFRPWKRGVVTVGLAQSWFSHPNAAGDSWKLCPMAGLTHNIVSRMQLTAGISRAVRFPSAQQLFSEASGNPDLLPEEAWKAEAGLSVLLPHIIDALRVRVEAVMHWSELKDLIHRASSAHRFSNISSARLYGAEFRCNARFDEKLEVEMSYDHLQHDVHSVTALRNVPPRVLRLAWQYSIAGFTLRHEYGAHDVRATLRTEFPLLPAYSTHTAVFSFHLSDALRLRVRVINLFDSDYQEEVGYPATGRMFIAGMTWQR